MKRSELVRRWLGSTAAIAVAVAWLHQLGAGDLGAPPLSLDGASTWLDHRDTALAAFAVVRLVALGFGWYLLLVTAVGGLTRYLRLPRMTSLVDRLTLPFARGMLGGMALLGAMAVPPPLSPHAANSMIELPSDAAATTTTFTPPGPTAVLHLVPDTPIEPSPVPPASAPVPEPSSPTADEDSWVIQPGESFWSIATDHLVDLNGGPVSEHEVAAYWRELVEVNRSQLMNPDDADLLFTGQVVQLPAVAAG
ncbi:MAG: resuscitation-promoting factor RpfA [Acidimicrobiaceae bacterium]|jgi:hypothetical protein